MSKIKIITDGSCDLPIDVRNKLDINIVPLNVSFGDEHFVGGIDIDNDTFYERMSSSKELPKTSCPSPERIMEFYKGEEDVLMLTLTSKLSATYSTAVLAKDMYLSEIGEKNIQVVDTESGSVGAGLMVIKAAELIKEGKTMDEILVAIEKMKEEIVFFGTLETLENAIKGGRVNPVAGKIINALNFKVIIHITDGLVKPVDKARGENQSIKKVLEKVFEKTQNYENKILAIGHSNCEEKAKKVRELIEEKYKFRDIVVSEIGSVMGTYTSKGAILVSVL